jgi:2Fe-2S ferredoxin
MVEITFIEANGSEHVVDGKLGNSLMETAIHNGIRGLLAECGGACSCATCHLYIDAQWVSAVGEASGIEQDMLEMVVDRAACSRLACQVMVRADYDGLVVRIPQSQVGY